MAKKCVLCGKTKGKRGCLLHEMKMICPQCCAGIRNAACGPCSFYNAAEKYQDEKYKKSGGRSFVIDVDESIDAQVDEALGEIEKKRFDKAEKILMPLYGSHSDNFYINYGVGAFYAIKGENQKAIDHFKKAVEMNPYFVEAYFNLGIAYNKDVDIAGMVRAFRKVVRLCPEGELFFREANRMLASVELSVREVNGTDLDTFIKAQDFFEKGMQLMKAGEYEKAIDAYQDSLALNTSTPQPYGNMGICYAVMGKKEAAIEAFDKALAIDPDYELAIVNKVITEKLAPGEKLDLPIETVSYYKEYDRKEKSYIEEMANELKNRMNESKKE